jgi:hypothetical protein
MKAEVFLNTPVNALGLDREFCEQCDHMGFETVREIVSTSPAEIIKREGFTYHWLAELSEMLNKEGLLHLLQPLPGSIHD